MGLTELQETAAACHRAIAAFPWANLEPLRAELSRPQVAFNDAVVKTLSEVTSGLRDLRGADEAAKARSRLQEISEPTKWQVRSHRGGVVGGAVGLLKTSALKTLELGFGEVFERQRRWNLAAIQAILAWSQHGEDRAPIMGELSRLTDGPATSHGGVRQTVWASFLAPQVAFNRTLLSFLQTPARKNPVPTFHYRGYDIPEPLMEWTGGGTQSWDFIARGHMEAYARYSPILPSHAILEIGCGVGRDAMQLTDRLTSDGRYSGMDIMKPSIEWCQQNITPRHPNFVFHHLDIYSQAYNPGGVLKVTDVRLPTPDASVDRILLQSVFTHMFRDDIVHYLHEFRRVLKPGGLVFASFFFTDPEALALARAAKRDLLFPFEHSPGCRIHDPENPERAVGYTKAALEEIFDAGGMELDQPIHRGFWSSWPGVPDGQDIAILRAR